jgi:hypothetical protein
MLVNPGLDDPKARPKGVVDGMQVNIPALFMHSDGVTLLTALCVRMVMTFSRSRFFPGKSGEV